MSTMGMPTLVGCCSSDPLIDITPVRAWTIASKPGCGPSGPSAEAPRIDTHTVCVHSERSCSSPSASDWCGRKFSITMSATSCQAPHLRRPIDGGQVELDRPAVAVECKEVGGVGAVEWWAPTAGLVADTWAFDLHHVCAEVGQGLRSQRTREDAGKVEHPDRCERQGVVDQRIGRPPARPKIRLSLQETIQYDAASRQTGVGRAS